jgi:hypothetical protein
MLSVFDKNEDSITTNRIYVSLEKSHLNIPLARNFEVLARVRHDPGQ